MADFAEALRIFLHERSKKYPDMTKLGELVERLFKEDPKTFLAYAFGKPVETHEISGPDGGPIQKQVITIDINELRKVARVVYGIPGPDSAPKPLHPPSADGETSDIP
jgi:hypothetical protein